VYPALYANPIRFCSRRLEDVPVLFWSNHRFAVSETETKYRMGRQAAVDGILVPVRALPLDRCPAAVYLAQLKPSSRRTQKQALNLVATLLTGCRMDCLTLDWAAARYPHTAAVRGRLLDGYAPATANRILSALRGVPEQTCVIHINNVPAVPYQIHTPKKAQCCSPRLRAVM